jgi:hypothetical protein
MRVQQWLAMGAVLVGGGSPKGDTTRADCPNCRNGLVAAILIEPILLFDAAPPERFRVGRQGRPPRCQMRGSVPNEQSAWLGFGH